MKKVAPWNTEVIGQLKEMGLTEYDSKVYLTLVSKSPLAATDISREADVPMSKIYGVLSRLENGGWISVVPERPKQYRALDPGVTIDNACKQAVERLESSRSALLVSLKEIYAGRSEVESSEFLVVHGTVNVLNHLKEIVGSQQTGITVAAAFANPGIISRFHDMVASYPGPKRLYLINDRDGLKQFAGLLEHLSWANSIETEKPWREGVVFVYTRDTGVYASVEGDEFRMALIIRDRSFLDLIKMFVETSHGSELQLDPADPMPSRDMLNDHKAKARNTLNRMMNKHR
ncbi:MAG TPA: helix-turn-helix domain-containing protein [Methanocella sp.]|nr:helix-turn-helix domain-containing protein [Methanocella sp.]